MTTSATLENYTTLTDVTKEFARSHAKRVEELMSNHVVTATEDASLNEIASLLEKHHIKRVPILKDGKIVGVVIRSNLVQALASAKSEVITAAQTDHMLRAEIVAVVDGLRRAKRDCREWGGQSLRFSRIA